MRIFISGGCKNGKSTYAQSFAAAQQKEGRKLYYIATMIPRDAEDHDRILRHQAERAGQGFDTLEIPGGIESCIPMLGEDASVLLDSATALLANEMFAEDGSVDLQAAERVAKGLETLVSSLGNIVVVSDALYSDAFLYDELTEEYRRGLALIDKTLARCCDVVLEACFGTLIAHRGAELLKGAGHEIY